MFDYNLIAITGCISLFLLVVYQIYFYFSYLLVNKNELESKTNKQNFEGKISVIIVAENETYQLKRLLPLMLEQDYKDFEVIVVNYGSNEETELIFEDLYAKYKNLYTTFLPTSADKGFNKKKLALTLGAKAAKGDYLIFTEYYTMPKTNQWLSKMISSIDENTEIILGISNIEYNNLFFNGMARYNNLFFTAEYISATLKNKPYTGTFRNLGLKRSTFFLHKGFANSLNIPNSEDIFINQIINSTNTTICIDSDATIIADYDNHCLWSRVLKNFSLARTFFVNYNSFIFSFEKLCRVLIYILSLALIIYSILELLYIPLIITILLLFTKIFFNYYIVYKDSILFDNGKFKFTLPFIDFFEAIYCVKFRTRKND